MSYTHSPTPAGTAGTRLVPAGGSTHRRRSCAPITPGTYDLGGRCGRRRASAAPTAFDGLDPDKHSLVELPVERWHGWLFVHALSPLGAGGREVDFAAHVGALEDIVGPYAPESLVLADRHTYEVAANWKVLAR
jgi:Rieske 2Fe-2S family protein